MSDLERIAELAEQVTPDLLGLEPETEQEQELAKWRITNKTEAAWAMEKLAGYVRSQEENTAVAEDRIAAVREWCRRENGKLDNSVEFFTDQLRRWHMSLVSADPADEEAWKKEKNKTINLPDGVVSVRKGSYSTVIEDEPAVVEWAANHREDLLRRTFVPAIRTELAEHIKSTGEIPPGVKYERSEPKFDVKPKVGE